MPPASEDNCPAGRQAELMAETIMDNCNGDNNASLILRTWDPLHRTAPCLFLLTGGWRRAQKYAIKREKNPTATQDLQRSAAKYKKKKNWERNNSYMCEWQRGITIRWHSGLQM